MDFNEPVSFSVYEKFCWEPEGCLPIWEPFKPLISFPSEAINPEWKNCLPTFLGGFDDPPRVLTPAGALVYPTPILENPTPANTQVLPAATAELPGAKNTNEAGIPESDRDSHDVGKDSHFAIPSMGNPPARNPLLNNEPPARTPTSESLPQGPSITDSQANHPLSKHSTLQDPPVNDSPVKNSPAKDSPPNRPPAHDSAAHDLPDHDSPARDPPINDVSPESPPGHDPPAKNPNSVDPPPRDLSIKDSPAEKTLETDVKEPFVTIARLFTTNNDKVVIIGSATLSAGESAATVWRQPISVGDDGIIIGDKKVEYSTFEHSEASLTVGTDLQKGVPILTADGKTFLAARALVLSETAPSSSILPLLTIESNIYTANTGGEYVVEGHTLTPAGSITVSGEVISLDSSASNLIIGGSTKALARITSLPILTTGPQSYSATNGGKYHIGGHVLTAGGAITNLGTVISLAPSASALVVGGTTHSLLYPNTALAAVALESRPDPAHSADHYIVNGHTLTPGEVIIDSGSTISLAPSASTLVIGSRPQTWNSLNKALPTLTIGSHAYTADPTGGYIIDHETLHPGDAITVSNSIISLAPGASALVIDGTTKPLSPLPTTKNLAQLIMQAFETPSNANAAATGASTSTGGVVFQGSAGRKPLALQRNFKWLLIPCYLVLGTVLG